MELDRILYIFGSFTRKKQDKRKSLEQQCSISAGNSPRHVCRPTSQNLNVAPRTSAYQDCRTRSQDKELECGLCGKEVVEPRLLGCLHSFCTRCLQGLHQEGEAGVWSEVDGCSIQLDPGDSNSASGSGSAGSGYESDLQPGSDGSWHQPRKYGIFTRKISGKSVQFLLCPTCGADTTLPLGGIAALPVNYVMLRKMAAAQEEDNASVLCDLCNCDNKAESQCGQCLVTVCTSCGDAHSKQQVRHSLRALRPGGKLCDQHPGQELTVYCATCQQVVCHDCCVAEHEGHALSHAARAAGERARLLRDACERARCVPDSVDIAAQNLSVQAMQIDMKSSRVEAEVQAWAEQYRRAVELHTRAMCVSAARARARHAQRVQQRHQDLEQLAHHAREAVSFTEQLLSVGGDAEVLSLSGPVLRRLEQVGSVPRMEAPRCDLRLAPLAPAPHHPALRGRLFTHAADPETSVLDTQGLQDLRVNCPHEAILELRDSSGERIWCGGEQVSGYFRRRDSSARPAAARVIDRGDGTYTVTVAATTPGAYLLAVTINNKPIKGSPWPCAVRSGKAVKEQADRHSCVHDTRPRTSKLYQFSL